MAVDTCPSCKEKQYYYHEPHFGEKTKSFWKCNTCGHKKSA